jgi:thiamine kinase-like enzyme
MPANFKDTDHIADVMVKVISYRPGTRCTIRYDLHSKKLGKSTPFSLYGKVLQGDQGRIVNERMQALWDLSLQNPRSICVAQPLGYSDAVKTVWQQAIDGTALNTVLSKSNYKKYLEKVTKGLACLHNCDLSAPAVVSDYEYVKDARKKAQKVCQEFPELKGRYRAIVDLLESTVPLPGSYTNTLIHGDLHLRQLLLHNHNVYFFDFDEFAIGDPLQDLAQFIIDIHLYDFDPQLVKAMSKAFLSMYQEQVLWEVPIERLMWRCGTQLINKTSRYVKQQDLNLFNKIKQLLGIAESVISRDLATNKPYM